MSSFFYRFPSIKELHDIPDVPLPELMSNTTKRGLTEIEEQEEVINQKGEFVSGMNPPLPGKNFDRKSLICLMLL